MVNLSYIALSGGGNFGKTTLCRHVLAPGSSAAIVTRETRTPDGAETAPLDPGALAARLFAPPADGIIVDVGVGDVHEALEALALVNRQDSGLPDRLRIVTPLLNDAKSVAGLRWLLAQLPDALCPVVRAIWNRVRPEEESARKDSELVRAARSVARQAGAQLCSTPLYESALYDPGHPLVRRHGSVAALAGLSDATIREAALGEMSMLLAARDAAQRAQTNCREVYTALTE